MIPQARCQFCGADLTEAVGRLRRVCQSPKCQLAWAGALQSSLRVETGLREQTRQQVAEAYLGREAGPGAIGRPPACVPAAVPANLRRVVTLPERRKRAFRDHLMRLVSQAAAARASPAEARSADSGEGSPAAPSSALTDQLQRGCATCRGRCCNAGGEHAYLDVATLLRYMQGHPDERPRHVLEAYLSCLPGKAYEDSCVFHTESGCALPREMRSSISVEFFCEELWSFQRRVAEGGPRDVVFVAIEGTRVVRAEPLEAASAARA